MINKRRFYRSFSPLFDKLKNSKGVIEEHQEMPENNGKNNLFFGFISAIVFRAISKVLRIKEI